MPTPSSSTITHPKRVSELVVDQLESYIRDGLWPVGSRIPAEPELVNLLGVGRNTLREAVRALEHAGLLEPRRGDGTYVRASNALAGAFVRRLPTVGILDLLQVRGALEREAARAAPIHRTKRQLKAIKDQLTNMEKAYAADDLDRYVCADVAFHAAVVAAAGNAVLTDLYAGLTESMAEALPTMLASINLSDPIAPGHLELYKAIREKDPDRAEHAVRQHLEAVRQALPR